MVQKIKHIKLEKCESTQEELKNLLSKESTISSENVLVSTLIQSKGIGRRYQSWIKPENSIAFSLLISPNPNISLSSLELGLLVSKYLTKKFNKEIKLKWPNDLILEDKKIGGIICNLINQQLIAGIGINIGKLEELKLDEKAFAPGSVNNEIELGLDDYHQLPYEISNYILKHRIQDQENLITDWNKYCFHINSNVKIIDGNDSIEGLFRGIGKNGEALIEKDNQMKKIYNGTLRLS